MRFSLEVLQRWWKERKQKFQVWGNPADYPKKLNSPGQKLPSSVNPRSTVTLVRRRQHSDGFWATVEQLSL